MLAFVSKPGFDPNLFVDGIDSANWEALNDSPDKPMLNRPLRGAYPPGSTIKPYLALGALTSGKRTPQQTIFDPGYLSDSPGSAHRFRDDKPGGHGTVDMYKSIVVSCDTYYYMLASETDIDDTARFMSQLGFGADDRHRHRRRADRHAAVAGVEAQALRRHELPRGASQVVLGRQRSPRASARATTRSRRCSRRTRSRRSPTTASRTVRICVKSVRRLEHRRGCARSRREPVAHDPGQARHLAFDQERAGRRQQGGHGRRGVRQGAIRERAARRARRRCIRSKARNTRAKVDERLRDHAWFIAYAPADKPRIAARGAGRERRLRRARRRADRAQGFDYYLTGSRRAGPRAACPAPSDPDDESD